MNANQIRVHPRRSVAAIFDHALSAVDPRQAVKNVHLDLPSGPIYSIAIGKGAKSMARGLEDALGDKLTAPVLIAMGGHPLPDENSLAAAQVTCGGPEQNRSHAAGKEAGHVDAHPAGTTVQCESCHGPGSLHSEEPSDLPLAKGNQPRDCVGCHDPENSPHFAFESYLEQILGPGHGRPVDGGTRTPAR